MKRKVIPNDKPDNLREYKVGEVTICFTLEKGRVVVVAEDEQGYIEVNAYTPAYRWKPRRFKEFALRLSNKIRKYGIDFLKWKVVIV